MFYYRDTDWLFFMVCDRDTDWLFSRSVTPTLIGYFLTLCDRDIILFSFRGNTKFSELKLKKSMLLSKVH